jgi:hypothetical protein
MDAKKIIKLNKFEVFNRFRIFPVDYSRAAVVGMVVVQLIILVNVLAWVTNAHCISPFRTSLIPVFSTLLTNVPRCFLPPLGQRNLDLPVEVRP